MLDSSQNTILRAKYFKINTESPHQSKNQPIYHPDHDQECFTPVFRPPDKIPEAQPLRKTDKLQKYIRIYDEYQKTAPDSKPPTQTPTKNPQHTSINLPNSFDKVEPNHIYETPFKQPQFIGVQQKENSNSNYKNTSKQFLFINSPLQSYSTPFDFDNPEMLLPKNAEILKHHLEKAKAETQRLKDEQLKLKLEKVKITAKKSQNQTIKLVPLKIQHQRLKKQIEKLLQEKQILQMNKKIKETSKSSDIKINGMQFKVLKHIPGTVYSNQELQSQNDSIQFSRVIKKSSNSSFIQSSLPYSGYSNSSLPQSCQSLPMEGKAQGEKFQVGSTIQSPTYFTGSSPGIRRIGTGNEPQIQSMNEIPIGSVKQLTGASLIHSEMEKMKQNDLNRSQDKNSRSGFYAFAKTSLKNGYNRPTFCKNPNVEGVQSVNFSTQGYSEASQGNLSSESPNQNGINYGNRPGTSASYSPRNQSQFP